MHKYEVIMYGSNEDAASVAEVTEALVHFVTHNTWRPTAGTGVE